MKILTHDKTFTYPRRILRNGRADDEYVEIGISNSNDKILVRTADGVFVVSVEDLAYEIIKQGKSEIKKLKKKEAKKEKKEAKIKSSLSEDKPISTGLATVSKGDTQMSETKIDTEDNVPAEDIDKPDEVSDEKVTADDE
jgi:hypothetical protein